MKFTTETHSGGSSNVLAMTQAPTGSRRRASRILIAGGIAFLIAAVWWGRTPNVDPRLVGFWSVSQPGDSRPPRTWVLESNGTCRHVDQHQREELVAPWRVDGETVIFGQGPLWASDAMEAANALLRRVFRWQPLLPAIALRIVAADDQAFLLQHAGGGQLSFSRIPAITLRPRPINDSNRVLMAVALTLATAVFLLWNARRRRKRRNLPASVAPGESNPAPA